MASVVLDKPVSGIELGVIAMEEKGQLAGDPTQVSFSSGPLVEHKPSTGSWRCAIIGLICFSVILVTGIIVFSVLYSQGTIYYTEPDIDGASVTGADKMATPYTFDDIFDPDLQPRGFSADFIGDGHTMVRVDDDGNLIQYDPATAQTQIIMANSTFEQVNTGTYYVSWDLEWVLLAYEVDYLWRSSYSAKYIIYERATGQLISFPNDPVLRNSTLQLCRFASRTNQLGFVYANNLYYQADPTSPAVQITTDGDPRSVYNGIANYVYEEEITYSSTTHYFSPAGGFLLYARMDDTNVPEMSFVKYGVKSNMYPEVVSYTYPKPGDLRDGALGPNTITSLHVVSTASPDTPWTLPPPVELGPDDLYYKYVEWVDDANVLLIWKNRVQNRSIAMFCDVTAQTCVKNHDLQVTGGWVDDDSSIVIVDGGTSYVTILAEEVGGQGSWLHVAQVTLDPTGPGAVTFLSSGAQEARFIVGYDSVLNFVYYLDTNGDSTERHLFRVGTLAAAPADQNPVCITCDVNPGCLYVSSEFSPDGKYYILTCRGPDIPTYSLKGVDDALDLMLENNSVVSERLAQKLLPTREYISIDVGGGQQGYAMVSYPPGYNATSSHPMIQDVYGGPNSKSVTKTYPLGGYTSNWFTYLQSSHGAVWTVVDGRGTHSAGQDLKYLMYRGMGGVENEDQVIGAKFFKGEPYVDETQNAAIFGWSYGGTASAQSLAYDEDTFQCAISVAPVTHFHYYDTAYTERYNGLVTDNQAGYNDTDIMANAAGFAGKHLMLVHGVADDNVQVMNFMQLADAIIDNGGDLRQHLYVDENHGIGGSSRHLYTAFTEFMLRDCWNMQ